MDYKASFRQSCSVCNANFLDRKRKIDYKLNLICILGSFCHRVMLFSGRVFQ